jgi:hypothetical protein
LSEENGLGSRGDRIAGMVADGGHFPLASVNSSLFFQASTCYSGRAVLPDVEWAVPLALCYVNSWRGTAHGNRV